MKLGIVTDIHAGNDFNTKRGSRALDLLAEALAHMKSAGCDLVIDLGDRISEESRGADLALAARIGDIFAASGLRHAHLCGNHDLYGLDEADNAAIFGPVGSRLIEADGLSLALFQGDMDSVENRMRFELSEAKLGELKALLAEARGRTLLFSHVPLLSRSMEGSFYFERGWPGGHCYANADAIRSVLESAPNLVACLAGHVHWTTHMALDGIHLCTIGSLSETILTPPEPEGAYAIVSVADRLQIEVHGLAPTGYALPFRPHGHRWVNMDRPGAPRPERLSPRYQKAFANATR